MKRQSTRLVREIQCMYVSADTWFPMGRARTRCPRCGADISMGNHPIRRVPAQTKEAR